MEQDKPTIKQDNLRNPDGTLKKGAVLNPTGKGGLQERPEDINYGGRPKNSQRFGYWLQFFKDLSVDEFLNYTKTKEVSAMYMAEAIAYERVKNARKDLKEFQDLADRTEGKATQNLDVRGDITIISLLEELTGEIINDNKA